jgi:hypothetical protein
MAQFLCVVIPENKKQRLIQGRNDEIEVIKGQIPCGKDKIDIGEALLYIRGVYLRVDLVGNTEDFQGQTLIGLP